MQSFQLWIFVFPFMRLSTVDCVMPDNVASLLIVIFRSAHKSVNRLMTTSEYVIKYLLCIKC